MRNRAGGNEIAFCPNSFGCSRLSKGSKPSYPLDASIFLASLMPFRIACFLTSSVF